MVTVIPDYTFFIQLANFLVLVIILNILLFKPVLRHLSERDTKIARQHEDATGYADKAQVLLREFEHDLADARVKATQAYHSLQQEGISRQRERLSQAKSEAQSMMEKARAQVSAESAKAKEILEKEMAKLPGEIASKLLGRPV
ncbi:MAG: ATP synthase F0 subunit B [Nitrospirota bacterium]